MPLLLEACRSFREPWEKEVKNSYVNLNEDGTRLQLSRFGDFARHLLDLYGEGIAPS